MFVKRGDEVPISKVLSEEEIKEELKKYQQKKEDTNKTESKQELKN